MAQVKVDFKNFNLDFALKRREIDKRVITSARVIQKEAKNLLYKGRYPKKVSGYLKKTITARKWRKDDIGATVFHKFKKGEFFYPAILVQGRGKSKGYPNWIADAYENKKHQVFTEISNILKDL